MTITSAATLHKLPSTTTRSSHGREITLSRYAVIVDGQEIGQVFQHRAESMTRYSGRMYGYSTQRTCWAWESADFGGDYEMSSRKEAVADLLSMQR